MNYLYTLKCKVISTETIHTAILHLLFYKEGFSFYVQTDEKTKGKLYHFQVTQAGNWEEEIAKELETNLLLRRNFGKVNVAFISSFFSLVPLAYKNENPETLLNFSEAEFEVNYLMTSNTQFGNCFVYGVSQNLIDILTHQYKKLNFCHSGSVLLNALSKSDAGLHIFLWKKQLEVVVLEDEKLLFYNMFDTPSGEDVLFYTLFVLEQLSLNPQKVSMKTYGELNSSHKVFQLFKKYVKNVSAALKDEVELENFTLYNVEKCELSQEISEEKE